jgi:hypothetical protein
MCAQPLLKQVAYYTDLLFSYSLVKERKVHPFSYGEKLLENFTNNSVQQLLIVIELVERCADCFRGTRQTDRR